MNTILSLFIVLSYLFVAFSLIRVHIQTKQISEELTHLHHKLDSFLDEKISPIGSPEEVTETLTPYEVEKKKREEEFDERIAKMKVELQRKPTVADELHPLVRNLPHSSVDVSTMIDTHEEYAR